MCTKKFGCLQDDAPSVRQAAADLLGGHIGDNIDLAVAYFDTLVTVSRDTATSVRQSHSLQLLNFVRFCQFSGSIYHVSHFLL
jgi:hypothetical protein